MNRWGLNRRRVIKILAALCGLVFLLSGGLLLLHIYDSRQTYQPNGQYSDPSVIRYNDKEYRLREGVETVLVLGLDHFAQDADNSGYTNDQLADFVFLLVVDNEKQTYSAIHLNRDTIAEMNILGVAGETVGQTQKQLALSYAYGNGRQISCRNTADAVSKLLMDIPITTYLSVTMDAVSVVNDAVGGVEVEVLDDFTGIDDTLVRGKTVTLTGEHALTYVRSRSGMKEATNQRRMVRQKQYLEGLIGAVHTAAEKNDQLFADVSAQIHDQLVANCTVAYLQTLFEKLTDYRYGDIYSLEGEQKVVNNLVEFYPDSQSVYDLVIPLMCDEIK